MDTKHEPESSLTEVASDLCHGLIVLDADGNVLWMDDSTRDAINGEAAVLQRSVVLREKPSVPCVLTKGKIVAGGNTLSVCILRECVDRRPTDDTAEFAAVIETVMADSSWFTRTIVEKFRAIRQVSRTSVRSADLDMLTDRERDILALICEGRSDFDMSHALGLSQNTVRNHVASLYRKIGVHRRSAAIIWARERAITSQDVSGTRSRRARGSIKRQNHES